MDSTRREAIARRDAAQPLIEAAMVEQQSQRVVLEQARLAAKDFLIRVTICDGDQRTVEDVSPTEEICYDPDPGDDVHVGPLWGVQRDAAVTLVWFRRDRRSVPGVIEARFDTRIRAEREACAAAVRDLRFKIGGGPYSDTIAPLTAALSDAEQAILARR